MVAESKWQGNKDSNLGMPESKSGALTSLAIPLHNRLSGGGVRMDEFNSYDCNRSGCPDSALTTHPCQPDGTAWSTCFASGSEPNRQKTQAPEPVMQRREMRLR